MRVPGGKFEGVGEFQRGGVGFVGGVQPVALVFHLENVAGKFEGCGYAVPGVKGKGGDVEKGLVLGKSFPGMFRLSAAPSAWRTVQEIPASDAGCRTQIPMRLRRKVVRGLAVEVEGEGSVSGLRSGSPRQRKSRLFAATVCRDS